MLPSKSPLLTAIEVNLPQDRLSRIRIVSVYNPPTHNTGLPVLKEWLAQHHDRRVALVVGIDSNLHHTLWNPAGYRHTHTLAKELIKTLGSAGFTLKSQKQVPTFFSRARNTSPTTIDLTWINYALTRHTKTNTTSSENCGSDHQLLLTTIGLDVKLEERTHNTARFETMAKASFCDDLENQLSSLPRPLCSIEDIDDNVKCVTTAIVEAFSRQGKIVKTAPHRHKPWWNEEVLGPIIRERNRARRWMIISKTQDARNCYKEWHDFVRGKINELKRKHWKVFLAKANGALSFKAFKYTQSQSTNAIAPLYRQDLSLATDKPEQAALLFQGTSVVRNTCIISDIIPPQNQNLEVDHPLITDHELDEVLRRLPTKRAKGGDDISNDVLKLAKSLLIPILVPIFNACLKFGYFPKFWRTATTAILRKNDKDDYSEAGAYRPIALLSCLGKVLETVITRRLAHWAETNQVLAQGHVGGRRQHSVEEAFVILTTWIHHKWREGKVVSGLFLDLKSAYPLVHKKRLIHTLTEKNCPAYLVRQIGTFLEDRTTDLRLQDYLSIKFNVEDGLPQGSPLSVILYLLYNSSLLIATKISFKADKISLGFIDDVTHVVANKGIDLNILDLEEEGDCSLEWGQMHGTNFDRKKAQIMHFTHRKHSNPSLWFGDQEIKPQTVELRWLGLWLDPKLTFKAHIHRMEQKGKATLAQLQRISRCYHGLNPKEVRVLVATILKPRILFESIVWFTTRTEGKVSKILSLLQNKANRLILGAFKSSPVSFLKHDADEVHFKDLAIRHHHNYLYKRLTAPPTHPTRRLLQQELLSKPRTHQSPIHRLLRQTDMISPVANTLETIYPYPEPPWMGPRWTVENVGIKREEAKELIKSQIETEQREGACVIFTDGLFIPDVGARAAIAFNQHAGGCAYGPLEGISNYEMETVAFMLAMKKFKQLIDADPECFNSLAIFSDSQAALDLVAKPMHPATLQYLARYVIRTWKTNTGTLPGPTLLDTGTRGCRTQRSGRRGS